MPACLPPCPARSGHVYKAKYHGEVVAAKEVPLDKGADAQAAFILVSSLGRLTRAGRTCRAVCTDGAGTLAGGHLFACQLASLPACAVHPTARLGCPRPAQEALRLHQLRHPHVVGFVGVSVAEGKGIILMELCEGRDLHSALTLRTNTDAPYQGSGGSPPQQAELTVGSAPASSGSALAKEFAAYRRRSMSCAGDRVFGWYRRGRHVAYDIARGLNYLHCQNVVHMDIKSSNVLLTSYGAAKLADVGFSRVLSHTFLSDLGSIVGTFAWWATAGTAEIVV